MDLERVKRVGIAAAYKGAAILRSTLGNLSGVHRKGTTDLVTAADIESENKMVSLILKAFPDHSILAEESGLKQAASDYKWLIDPLDGTTNFAHRLPIFSISIAFAVRDEIIVGLVLNPMSGELFSATRDCGAQLNGASIRISSTACISDSLVATGFPYGLHADGNSIVARFSNCLRAAQGIRRLGSAALDLCYVACGRFDGFWEQGLKPWDTAAGSLIATEAGARVTDFSNQPFRLTSTEILATNDRIHNEMLALLTIDTGK